MKKIDIKEFRKKGYLQELNRQFLHPLGLALEVKIDDDSNEKLGGIQDSREDPEGFIYDFTNFDAKHIEIFKKNAEFIEDQFENCKNYRMTNLGFDIEPIPKNKEIER